MRHRLLNAWTAYNGISLLFVAGMAYGIATLNENIVFLALFLYAAVSLYIKCPVCRQQVGRFGRIYMPFSGKRCRNCGCDLTAESSYHRDNL